MSATARPLSGGGPHGRRSVDDDDVEVAENRSQFAPKQQFAVDFLGFQKIVGFDVNGVGQKFQAGAWFEEEGADLGFVVDQQPMSGEIELVEIDSERSREIPCWSRSTARVRYPARAKQTAKFRATVDFPQPPLALARV